ATMHEGLEASYAHCQKIARASASSFYYSFLLLPRSPRMSMFALYAFLRRTDDLGDSDEPIDCRRASLARWRHSLHKSFRGVHDDPLFPALVDTIQNCGVSEAYLEDVIDGVEMDLEPTRYETFEHLTRYCHRVASAVGLACLPIWGCTNEAAVTPARN